MVKEGALQALARASVQNAHVSFSISNFPKGDEGKSFRPQFLKSLQSVGQPVLFTHQGLSGPAIIKLSGFAARIMAAVKYKATLQIDWVHDMNLSSREDLHALFLQTKRGHDRKKHIEIYAWFLASANVYGIFSLQEQASLLNVCWGDISKEVNRLC